MSGIGQSIPGITSPGTQIATGDSGGVVVPVTTSFQFTGAVVVTAGGPGEAIVNIGGVGSFANTNLNNLTNPVQPNQDIDLTNLKKIINSPAPTAAGDVANKAYVDAIGAGFMQTDFSNAVASANDLDLGTHQIHNVVDPTAAQDAATKNYVDSISPATAWLLAGNNLGGGEFLGSLNAFDVVMISNGVEMMRLLTTTLTMNLGAYLFDFAQNSLAFGDRIAGGLISGLASSLAFGEANGAGSVVGANTQSLAFGQALTGGSIAANGVASLSFGRAENTGAIQANNVGCFAFGVTDASGGGSIVANSGASMAFGSVTNGGSISSFGVGALCFGTADTPNSVQALGDSSLVYGTNNGVGGSIAANNTAATASGFCPASGTGGNIIASADASTARGYAFGFIGVLAGGTAAYAYGVTVDAASQIMANGPSSHAIGQANNGSNILSSGQASYAFGNADNASDINSSGLGSIAVGNAVSGFDILSSGSGSFAGGTPTTGTVISDGIASFAYGDDLTCNADLGQAFGLGNTNDSYASMYIGRYATTGGTSGVWVSTEPLLVLGNGANAGARNNAFKVDKDGQLTTTGAQIHKAITLIAAPYGISDRTDRTIIFDTTGAGGALTLPAGVDGLEYFFGPAGSGGAVYTLTPSGGNTIDPNVITALDTTQRLHIQFLGGVWYGIG